MANRGRPKSMLNMFNGNSQTNSNNTPIAQVGYDNPRENIDPHIKTKVLDTIESIFQKIKLLGKSVGSVLFINSNNELDEDNSNFFWDNTNKRLGIGTDSPVYPLEVHTSAAAAPGLNIKSYSGASTSYAGFRLTNNYNYFGEFYMTAGYFPVQWNQKPNKAIFTTSWRLCWYLFF